MSTALNGIVVTEIGGRVAAGLCGSLLMQLGATTIHIESDEPVQKAVWREQFAAGKLSFRPDPASASDRALYERLIARSDIVITSGDVDAEHLRLPDRTELDRVVCDITAFGRGGAFDGRPASELQVQALSGIMDTTGTVDGPPVPIGVPISDFLTAAYAVTASLGALRVRRRTGLGQRIDMALFDAAFSALGPFLATVLTRPGVNKSRLGNRHPSVAPWNLFPSRDGWVLICAGNQAQWERFCKLIGHPEIIGQYTTMPSRVAGSDVIDPLIAAWTRERTTAEAVAELVAVGVAGGPIAPIGAHPQEDNIAYRGMVHRLADPLSGRDVFVPGPPLRLNLTPCRVPQAIPAPDADRAAVERLAAESRTISSAPAAPGNREGHPERPLAGLRVVEIGQFTTAPLCCRQLAHLGAEIIKVEQPGGDESRTWQPQVNGCSALFRLQNADKRSLVLDLKSEFGREAVQRLIRTADVLVENLKPGTLTKFGLSPEQLRELNPHLVYCAISGFGAQSLYSSRPAFDMVIQAMSGLMAAVNPGGMPIKTGLSTSDTMGAEMATAAILAALEYREQSGQGQYIDLSMQDITAWLTLTAWNGELGRHPASALACSDGYVVAECAADDTRLPDAAQLAAMTRSEAVEAIEAAGIRSSQVLTVREATELPHTTSRGNWGRVEEGGALWPVLPSPMRLTLTPPRISHLAPPVDADGAAILAELGLERPEGAPAATARRA